MTALSGISRCLALAFDEAVKIYSNIHALNIASCAARTGFSQGWCKVFLL